MKGVVPMSILSVIGWILAALAGIVLLCLGVLWVQKRYPSEEYDERQKIARGKASSLAIHRLAAQQKGNQ